MKTPARLIILSILLFSTAMVHSQDFEPMVQKAEAFYDNKQYDSAAALFQVVIPLIEKEYGSSDTSHYSRALDKAGNSLRLSNQNEKAEKCFLDEKALYESLDAYSSDDYLNCLQRLGNLYTFEMGRYKDAEKIWKRCDTLFTTLGKGYEIGYANNLNNMALLYRLMGHYEQAVKCLEQAIEIVKIQLGEESPAHINLVHNLAVLYFTLGNYEEAEINFLYAKEHSLRETVDQDRYYAVLLSNLGNLYRAMGRNDLAAPFYIESIEIFKKQSAEINQNFTSLLNNLALVYLEDGKFDASEEILQEALFTDRKISGYEHTNCARDLNNLGKLKKASGNYDLAKIYFLQALEIYKLQLGNENQDYALVLNNLGELYSDAGRYDLADSLFQEALDIDAKRLGVQHPKYADILNNLGQNYLFLQEPANAGTCFEQAFNIYKYQIRTNTGFLSEKEFEIYLNTFFYHLGIYQSYIYDQINSKEIDGGFAYNIELTRKAILMASALKVKTAILESGDTSAINTFYDLRNLRKKIDKIRNISSDKQKEDPSLLEERANEIEKSLALKSQGYGKAQQENEITWQDINKNLNADEVAIEFSSFNYYKNGQATDSVIYCAFILGKSDIAPRIVSLTEEKALANTIDRTGSNFETIDQSYQDLKLYNLIWSPLDSLLKGIHTIYFAPSGWLNKISFAAIRCPDQKLLMEKYHLKQLSSTRTLALPEKQVDITDAVIYGGIKYEADTTAWLATAEKYKKEESEMLAYTATFRGITRGGWAYLPGTKKEAESISEKLAKEDVNTNTYTGLDALEESFYSLSGNNSPSIIHISTHGFYYPDTVSDVYRKKMINSSTGDIQFKYSDDPLLRSGLIMAGGERTWKGLPRPEGLEDGILTAREVSNMNLLNTELVVLSACQTGQGDVNGSEGVEGLQRGFKMAGVHYIIMSLWQVPDNETTEFMGYFYDNWPGDMTIREAFQQTQLKMKYKYPDEPYKWAGFVLME
jgi:CHAT domain-containing protein/Tfp pilus assembly protein PilF